MTLKSVLAWATEADRPRKRKNFEDKPVKKSQEAHASAKESTIIDQYVPDDLMEFPSPRDRLSFDAAISSASSEVPSSASSESSESNSASSEASSSPSSAEIPPPTPESFSDNDTLAQIDLKIAKLFESYPSIVPPAEITRRNSMDTMVTTGFFHDKFTEKAEKGLSEDTMSICSSSAASSVSSFSGVSSYSGASSYSGVSSFSEVSGASASASSISAAPASKSPSKRKLSFLGIPSIFNTSYNSKIHLQSFIYGILLTNLLYLTRPLIFHYLSSIFTAILMLLKHLALLSVIAGIIVLGYKAVAVANQITTKDLKSFNQHSEKLRNFKTKPHKEKKDKKEETSEKRSSGRSPRKHLKPMFEVKLRNEPKKLDITDSELSLLKELAKRNEDGKKHRGKDRERRSPSYERESSNHDRKTPSYERKTPNYERKTPTYERKTPVYERKTPNYERKTPNYERKTPIYERDGSNYEKITPIYERANPNYDIKSSRYDRLTPNYERSTPAFQIRPPEFAPPLHYELHQPRPRIFGPIPFNQSPVSNFVSKSPYLGSVSQTPSKLQSPVDIQKEIGVKREADFEREPMTGKKIEEREVIREEIDLEREAIDLEREEIDAKKDDNGAKRDREYEREHKREHTAPKGEDREHKAEKREHKAVNRDCKTDEREHKLEKREHTKDTKWETKERHPPKERVASIINKASSATSIAKQNNLNLETRSYVSSSSKYERTPAQKDNDSILSGSSNYTKFSGLSNLS